jgi:hypothetical protein
LYICANGGRLNRAPPRAQKRQTSQEAVLMFREALTALAVAVVASATLGVLIYLGADALMGFIFS